MEKEKQICNYDEMLELFARDRATGAGAKTAKERRIWMTTNQQRPKTIDEIDRMVSINETSLENFNSSDDIQVISTMSTSQMDPPKVTKSKSKKRKMEEEDVTSSKITATISDVANDIRESNKVLSLFTSYIIVHLYL